MNIIPKQPNPNGAYPPVQTWNGDTPPKGYYEITADISKFYNGFIIPTIEDGKITSFICNSEAWETWKAGLPPEPVLSPAPEADRDEMLVDHEYRLTLLELGVK